ncbi:MAG: hypothetical protein R3C19_03900 [Planctomycetaceae bacterium]
MSVSNRNCRSAGILRLLSSAALVLTVFLPTIAAAVAQDAGDEASVPGAVDTRGSETTATGDSAVTGAAVDAGAANKSAAVNKPALMLRTESGELIPLDRLGFDAGALQDLLQRVQLQNQVPLFTISEVNLSGRVERDLFRLNVKLSVTVIAENEWVRVPVGFGDMQVAGLPQTQDLPGQAAFFNADVSNRKEWWLFGRGIHELSVELIGQVRNTPTGRPRIRFTCPKAAQSHLVMQISELVDEVTGGGTLPPRVTRDTQASRTSIELWGMAGETELTWKPQPADSTEQLLVQASTPAQMTLDLRTVPASLSCLQKIEVSGGSVDSLTVRLPPLFTPVSIIGDGIEGSSIVRSFTSVRPADADDSEPLDVVVRFSEPVRGTVSLKYDLELSKTDFPQVVSLSLPDIDRVRNESGNVDILIPQGVLVEPDAATLNEARRKRVEGLTDTKTAATAYQLLSSESRIDLRVSEIEAFFAVEPQIEISTEENNNNVLLTARYPVNVIHGSLNEITVNWKDFTADGWQIWPGSPVLTTDDGTTPLPVKLTNDTPDLIQLVFPDRQTGQFLVELRAFRSLSTFLPQGEADVNTSSQTVPRPTVTEGRTGEFFLPDVVASTGHATIVTLVESDSWSIRLTKPDGISEFSSVPVSRQPGDVRANVQPVTARLVEESGSRVRARLTSQQPEVRASAVVELRQGIGVGGIHVHEELLFQVHHRDLDEIRLVVPDRVIPTVRLHGQPGTLAATGTSTRESVFQLPVQKRGELLIDVDYNWTPEMSESGPQPQSVDIPLVLSTLPVQEITVGTDLLNVFQMNSVPNWIPVYSPRFAAAWRSHSAVADVPVTLLSSLADAGRSVPQFTVIRTSINGDYATTVTRAVYGSYPTTVIFNVPAGCEVVRATVNGDPVEAVAISGNGDTREPGPRESARTATTAVSANITGEGGLWRVHIPHRDTLAAKSEATLVGLRVRQKLEDGHGLIAEVRPLLPMVSSASDVFGRIWLIRPGTDESLIPRRNDFGWMQVPGSSGLPLSLAVTNEDSLTPVLAAHDASVRDAVRMELAEELNGSGGSLLLVGVTDRRDGEFLRVSTRAVLLVLCVLAISAFAIFLRLQQIPATTLVVVSVAVLVVTYVLIPAEYSSVYWLCLAGILLGAFAAAIQRYFAAGSQPSAFTARRPDQSTIFVIERGSQQSGSSAGVVRPKQFPTATGATATGNSL